jgi:hypothetical protein
MRTPLALLVCFFFAVAPIGRAQEAADKSIAPGKKAPRGQLLEWKSEAGSAQTTLWCHRME